MLPNKKPERDTFKRIKITVEMKRKIIEKRERGVSVADLARTYNRSTSTICTILKNKDKIMEIDASKGVTRISTQRLRVLDDVERLLLVWINEKQLQGDTINENIICEKAKMIFAELVNKTPGSSTGKEVFKGSRGWFEKFKRRTGIHSIAKHGETAKSDAKAAQNFIADFKKIVETDGYLPEQVFSCDEVALFWKRMPKRTYLTLEENALPGHKPMNDRVTLLFSANASGDFKVKPLLVYHTETPQAFKKCKIQKSRLSVMWKSNNRSWVTRGLFIDWMNQVFGPSVKKYLLEMNLPLKTLLILDNAPAHPPRLADDLHDEFKFIKVLFLSSNTAPILQPMNQVIINFKKLYTKELFERCFEVTEETNLTLREFWNHHFHIATCLRMIQNAWESVTKRTVNSAWKRLWPECVVESEIERSAVEPVVDEIVSLGRIMGLEVDHKDIDDLVEEDGEEVTEEVLELHRTSPGDVVEVNLSEGEEEITENGESSEGISEMLKAWESVASFVQKHHPNKTVVIPAINLFNDYAVSYFHQILRSRQKL